MLLRDLLRTKNLDDLLKAAQADGGLKRHLGWFSLTLLGIGAIIGAGIFSTVGTAAAGGSQHVGAGPALILSFVLTAVACGFAALCYAELASMVPIAGSAYTYSYATLGELIAWIIGWDLMLEYLVGNIAVAISWSGYFQELMRGFGMEWPVWLGLDFRTATHAAERVVEVTASGGDALATLGAATMRHADAFHSAPHIGDIPIIFNLPAFAITMLLTIILVRGIRESAAFNNSMVILKLIIIVFFVAMGAFYVKPENWSPFAPNGFTGITGAAAIIFFAYIGFDAVSTAAEETKRPERDLPIAIIGSLGVCTIIYIAVAIVLTGMLPWNQLGTAEPLATAFSSIGQSWPALVISLGAVFATTSVLLVFLLGQPRIFFSMARDGLLPAWAAKIHPVRRTPYVTTWISGLFVALIATFTNIDEVVELTNIGTLFAFVLVCFGVTVLRYRDPQRRRTFRVPFGPWVVPLLGAASCLYLMLQLPATSWWRFIAWLILGAAVYCAYSWSNSVIGREAGRPARTPAPLVAMATGFTIMGAGLLLIGFAIPLPVARMVSAAFDSSAEYQVRSLMGVLLVVAGTVVTVVGALRAGPVLRSMN